MKTGIELIAEERREQIEKHGRTIENDVRTNGMCQLSDAAGHLSLNDWICNDVEGMVKWYTPFGWDEELWRKMLLKPYKERLIIAGALIAAEIDRIQYQNLNT